MEDHEAISSEFSTLSSIAKLTILKRLNKFEVVHDNNNIDEKLVSNKNEHRRALYNESTKHPKRHLDRAHSRLLNAEVLKSMVKTIHANDSLDNLSTKYELVLLGLKAKINSYNQLAVDLINKISKVDYLKNLYKELYLNEKNLAIKLYKRNIGKYVKYTKQEIDKIFK